jgi:hypothetical protein
MPRDFVASFYGGYEPVRAYRAPSIRIPRTTLLIGVAVVALLVFVVADVYAFEGLAVPVRVTAVDWQFEGTELATSPGFTAHAGQVVSVSLVCSTICYRFASASVNAPFTLVAWSLSYHPDQYTNVTVRAPTSAYDGPLTVSLAVTPSTATGTVV